MEDGDGLVTEGEGNSCYKNVPSVHQWAKACVLANIRHVWITFMTFHASLSLPSLVPLCSSSDLYILLSSPRFLTPFPSSGVFLHLSDSIKLWHYKQWCAGKLCKGWQTMNWWQHGKEYQERCSSLHGTLSFSSLILFTYRGPRGNDKWWFRIYVSIF